MNTQAISESPVQNEKGEFMNKVIDRIKRHQVVTFFIITFAITWPILILTFFVFPGNSLVQVLCGGPFAVFSPALAAMLITAIVEPQPKYPNSKPRWTALWSSFTFLFAMSTVFLVLSCQKKEVTKPMEKEIQELNVQTPEVTLFVRIAGELQAGNVIIAIHGGPAMTSHYMLNLESLTQEDYAVVTYDQRGVGRSSSPSADASSYTLEKYVEDLDAIRETLGIESVHLFGHSWGGIVALRYASLYPERVRSIVLMGSGPPTREQTLQCQQAIIQRVIELAQQGIISENPEPGSRQAERGYLPAYFSDPNFWFSVDDPGSAPIIDERTALVNDLTWTANANYDLTADLARIDHRVLNLWGEDDPARQVAIPALITALSNAELETVILPHCGHFWHECPDPFFQQVRDYLENLP